MRRERSKNRATRMAREWRGQKWDHVPSAHLLVEGKLVDQVDQAQVEECITCMCIRIYNCFYLAFLAWFSKCFRMVPVWCCSEFSMVSGWFSWSRSSTRTYHLHVCSVCVCVCVCVCVSVCVYVCVCVCSYFAILRAIVWCCVWDENHPSGQRKDPSSQEAETHRN
jgi:hypothetical protein